MFNLFEVFSTRIQDQSREFEAALSRIGSRRLATVTDARPSALAARPESAGAAPVTTDVLPPERRSKKQAVTAFA